MSAGALTQNPLIALPARALGSCGGREAKEEVAKQGRKRTRMKKGGDRG